MFIGGAVVVAAIDSGLSAGWQITFGVLGGLGGLFAGIAILFNAAVRRADQRWKQRRQARRVTIDLRDIGTGRDDEGAYGMVRLVVLNSSEEQIYLNHINVSVWSRFTLVPRSASEITLRVPVGPDASVTYEWHVRTTDEYLLLNRSNILGVSEFGWRVEWTDDWDVKWVRASKNSDADAYRVGRMPVRLSISFLIGMITYPWGLKTLRRFWDRQELSSPARRKRLKH